jgi:hypothetical protein
MWYRTTVACLLLLLIAPAALPFALPHASAAPTTEIVVGPDDTLTWEDDEKFLEARVTIYGTMVVRNYDITYNITQSGLVAFIVMDGGSLTFEDVTVESENNSKYMFFKVEGQFTAKRCSIDALSGSFLDGGGIKCAGGTVKLEDTTVKDCEAMAVYALGADARVTLENCTLTNGAYGIVAKDGATVVARNSTIESFTKVGVTLNKAEASLVHCTVMPNTSVNGTTGIAALTSELELRDTEVRYCNEDAVELVQETTAEIVSCEVHHSMVGIRMTELDGDVTINGSRIHHNLDGLNMYICAGVLIEQTLLVDNTNGLSAKDCPGDGYILRGCHIGNNTQLGAYIVGKGLHEDGTTWTDLAGHPNGVARLIQLWTLGVHVRDSDGRNVTLAKVNVQMANGTAEANYTTDSFGNVTGGIVLEGWKVLANGTRVDAGGHKITIKSGSVTVKKTVEMVEDRNLDITLGEVIPVSPLRTPLGWAVITLIFVAIGCAAMYWYLRLR